MNDDFTYYNNDEDDDNRIVDHHLIPFSELTEELKNQVRQHLRADDSFLDNDWHEFAKNDIIETYTGNIKVSHTEFDMYRDEVTLEGIILSNPMMTDEISNKIEKFIDQGWLDMGIIRFTNDDVPPDYFIDGDSIELYVRRAIFGNVLYASVDINKIKIFAGNNDVGLFSVQLSECIDSGEYDAFPESLELLKKWLNLCEISEIFFQDVEISRYDYDECTQPIIGDYVEQIHTVVEKEYMPIHQAFADKVSSEYRNALLRTYSSYFDEDEYIDTVLEGRKFIVGVDEYDEQISIDDLNGEW